MGLPHMFRWLVVAGLLAGGPAAPVVLAEAGGFADALVFDASTKEIQGKPGDTNFIFGFSFTNHATAPAVIESVRTSCGCTVARVPQLPWTIPPDGAGEFSVVLDARGKRGTITKSVFVSTSLGLKSLTVRGIVADSGSSGVGDDRLRNLQIALADRFAVFRGECASCHAKPAEGKTGPALYVAACGVCHDAHNRGSMVPDLKALPHLTDREHWLRWITFGRHGSLMPAFAVEEGGILTADQVDSLAEYLSRSITQRRAAQAAGRPLTSTLKIQPPPLPGGAGALPAR
jgi:mono/diheme cytochrome c family protein